MNGDLRAAASVAADLDIVVIAVDTNAIVVTDVADAVQAPASATPAVAQIQILMLQLLLHYQILFLIIIGNWRRLFLLELFN